VDDDESHDEVGYTQTLERSMARPQRYKDLRSAEMEQNRGDNSHYCYKDEKKHGEAPPNETVSG
jgi:hypothetical protein